MECKGHNILSRSKEGEWMTSYELTADLLATMPYDILPSISNESIELKALDITGALAPFTYVIGQWSSVFKRIAVVDDIERVRSAISHLQELRGHPHVIPLEHIVVEELSNEGNATDMSRLGQFRICGYTLPFLPDGTLEERSEICVDWIFQLARTADDLNFRHTLLHGDLFPRNMLVGPAGGLCLIDFDRSVHFDSSDCYGSPDFDASSVLCAIYEIITKKPSHGGIIDRTVGAEDRIAAWVARVIDPSTSWEAGEGVTIDINPNQLRDVLCRWRDARKHAEYSWTSFVDSERVQTVYASTILWHNGVA